MSLFGNSTQQLAASEPPHFAAWCLYMFLPRNQIVPIIGDIQEKFQTIMIPRVGRRWAVAWYYKETLASLVNWRLFVSLVSKALDAYRRIAG